MVGGRPATDLARDLTNGDHPAGAIHKKGEEEEVEEEEADTIPITIAVITTGHHTPLQTTAGDPQPVSMAITVLIRVTILGTTQQVVIKAIMEIGMVDLSLTQKLRKSAHHHPGIVMGRED